MKTILCFGDSNTWGWNAEDIDPRTSLANRFPFDVRWPGIAQQLLGSGYRIIEDALNGRTTSFDDPLYADRSGLKTLPVALECHTPIDLLVLMLGTNDVKGTYSASAGLISDAMDLLIRAASVRYAGGEPPAVLLICPPVLDRGVADAIYGYEFGPDAYGKSVELTGWYKRLAERHGCHVLDANEAGVMTGTTDGVHIGPADHDRLGRAVAKKIQAIFA